MEKSNFDRKEMLTSKTEVGDLNAASMPTSPHQYLSPNQMLEIVEQNGYKNPGLILG